ncbi:Glyoxylate/hydroxypyruvate reductase (D-isomer-specific 2-hydroxy acid dehydrogenase superfamily) [Handroanthus impetiginosus]|uniref:Glyoxylate/hydroxypyruvate reductase (D-isomer-specific 2-hydroxy acid dehydrogenase superfamily) n=1 Tax=Handroanthus impetiginosus TaxID=429701 RepID=A0A2G9G519_9LAMI|nr:Glyoxylate/hydroxypyruvate reductase (D-isomer-specific 2-hydroxy acid dehydrogenase superfamily) [Handroanthus impetiginosus]
MEEHHRDQPILRHEPPLAGEELPQLLIIRPSPKNAQSVKAILCFSMSPVTPEILRRLPALQLVMTTGTGVNHKDLPVCRRRGIAVANTADMFSGNTTDYAVGLLIDVMRKISPLLMDVIRKISAGDRFVRRGLWPESREYPLACKNLIKRCFHAVGISSEKSPQGKRVGMVGLGNIGSKVAKRLESCGCTISCTSRNKKPTVPSTFYPAACELASHSNILVICCSLTEQTRHMINNNVMAALGKNGACHSQVKRLIKGAGAGLDVCENEPNVPTELFGLM